MRQQCRSCGQLFENLSQCPRCGLTVPDSGVEDETIIGWAPGAPTEARSPFQNQPPTSQNPSVVPVGGLGRTQNFTPPPYGQTPMAGPTQQASAQISGAAWPPQSPPPNNWTQGNRPGGQQVPPSGSGSSAKQVILWSSVGLVALLVAAASIFAIPRVLGSVRDVTTAPAADAPVVPEAANLSVTGEPWTPGTGSSGAVPSGVPACPTEMSPVSWVERDSGSLVVCRRGDDYKVQLAAQPELHAVGLEFHPDSYRVTFQDKSQFLVALGGLVVQNGESSELMASSRAWNARHGELEGFAPGGLAPCPTETWPISLSSFTDGWLMVCGTDKGPVSMKFSGAGIGTGEATAVREGNGSFCASLMSQEACVFEAPALVTITDSRGAVSQASVSHNWFPGVGPGGAGQGSGFSEVAAPGYSGEDQVRYLVDILNESAAARSQLNPAVDNVSRCRNLPQAIRTIDSVTQNRYDLLIALDSTPVDQIDGGFELISLLQESLETSYDADLAWLTWAESERDNGCAYGSKSPLYKNAQSVNKRVDRPKTSFVNMWNSQIAPKYHVRKFTRSEI